MKYSPKYKPGLSRIFLNNYTDTRRFIMIGGIILTYQPVEAHEDQGVNARVSSDNDQILNDLAPNVAERPVRQHEIGGRERYTKYDE